MGRASTHLEVWILSDYTTVNDACQFRETKRAADRNSSGRTGIERSRGELRLPTLGESYKFVLTGGHPRSTFSPLCPVTDRGRDGSANRRGCTSMMLRLCYIKMAMQLFPGR